MPSHEEVQELDVRNSEAILLFVEKIKQSARDIFLKDGYHSHILFLFVSRDPSTNEPLPLPRPMIFQQVIPEVGVSVRTEKMRFSKMVKYAAEKLGGVAVVSIAESYMVDGLTPEEAKNLRTPISTHPRAKETLNIMVEHKKLSPQHRDWYADITRNAEGVPSLSDWKESNAVPIEGIMANFLPRPN